MYLPAHFDESGPEGLCALMARHPLGLVIRQDALAGLQADPVPLLWEAADGRDGALAGRLLGHVARANALAQGVDGQPVLVTFQGPEAYISPNWYPSKAEHGKAVPTWNYAVVQAHGTLHTTRDPQRLREIVHQLTTVHEAGQPRPWTLDEAPPDYLDALLRAITGVEIRVTRLVGKWKVSQNQTPANRAGVAAGLRALGRARADEMADLVDARP